MELPGTHLSALACGGITRWDAHAIGTLSSADAAKLQLIIHRFGQHSAKAQGLDAPVTDIARLRSTGQRLYLAARPGAPAGPGGVCVLAGLKIGTKHLFLRPGVGAAEVVEAQPCCVLDFYVHESCQRMGVGHALFQHMLAAERTTAAHLAYDWPSTKLLAFLQKHYALTDALPQANRFVVFAPFFEQLHAEPAAGPDQAASTRGSGVQASPGAHGGAGGSWATIAMRPLTAASRPHHAIRRRPAATSAAPPRPAARAPSPPPSHQPPPDHAAMPPPSGQAGQPVPRVYGAAGAAAAAATPPAVQFARRPRAAAATNCACNNCPPGARAWVHDQSPGGERGSGCAACAAAACGGRSLAAVGWAGPVAGAGAGAVAAPTRAGRSEAAQEEQLPRPSNNWHALQGSSGGWRPLAPQRDAPHAAGTPDAGDEGSTLAGARTRACTVVTKHCRPRPPWAVLDTAWAAGADLDHPL